MIQEATATTTIRPLKASEIEEADNIFRLAFGTFLGLPDPQTFMGDAGYVRTRWQADPTSAFAAEVDRRLAGSNFVANWGSVGFFGPLSVRPELWDKGVGGRLMEPVLQRFVDWKTQHVGLFTWSHSPKHIHLYQKFGFWPRFLTAIMSRPVAGRPNTDGDQAGLGWSRFSSVLNEGRPETLRACVEVTDAVFGGLDLSREIESADTQGLGDTVLLEGASGLAGFAVCHYGASTEAGSGACYIKFGVVAPGPDAARNFERLMHACESLAALQGTQVLTAGVNMGRHEAYRAMLRLGFRTDIQGVTMHRPNEPGYSRPDIFLVDDWR